MRQLYYGILMLLRRRGNNVTKTVSLTLGLFIGILLFACVAFQLSYNSYFHHPEQLYLTYVRNVQNGVPSEEFPYVYGPFAEALRENFPKQVEDATVLRDMDDWNFYNGNVRLPGHVIYADTHLFSTLGIRVLAGKVEDMQAADAVFVSRSYADKLRGNEDLSTVVGRQLLLDRKTTYIIRGVFSDQPENTDIPFDIVVSMTELWNNKRAGWGFDVSYNVIARFRNFAQDVAVAEARLPELMKKYIPNFNEKENNYWAFAFHPLTDVHTQNPTIRTMILVMSVLAIAILLIAAFNYILISVSSLARRAKEVGVHKCNGAANSTIFGMFLAETAVIVLLSVALSGLLMYLFRDFVEDMVAARLTSLFSVQMLWGPALVILFVFLLAGVLPAGMFSSVPVTQVFRRYIERNASWKRPLLFVQFMGVSFICCFLLVVFHQYRSVMNRPLGYDPLRVVICWANVGGSYENRMSLFGSLPMVEDYTCASQLICGGYSGDTFDTDEGRAVNVRLDWVTRNFIPMMKIELAEGRNFNPANRTPTSMTDSNEMIVNETFIRNAGFAGSAVGRTVKWYGESFTIVGVMKDYPVHSAYEEQAPVVLLFKEDWGSTHYIRLKEPFEKNLLALNRKMQDMFPSDLVEFTSLQKTLDGQYTDVRRFRNAVLLSSASIFLIALMGLLGYVNDEVRRRSKEIAIRKVNGAEAASIIRLLTRDIVWIALPALTLGAVFASVFGRRWLDSFAQRAQTSAAAFVAVVALLLVIIAACIVWRTRKIACENPVKSIRSE
ncbi:ABC transporter permease [Bacteroides helcogenes]|uniref:ABC3 transporter permease protein domain-containing protein n=1 Tax=Bacteroides helcogenes (strain ATCC 35417 / DSM 20613 / JCM 6297 / CCUG 15421 / P 36-108) TaxID=693979 RepID=E6SS83_BACT6|nr:FtsX-like permease family protein [Bacteroides helcogenes]ADV44151.1 protein of unknown function DUF214 [Bacteroides helcogenes P 36-108]MDY5238436.1 FtsX-like permease family protein [Bacteroides helcogenes]